MVRMWMVAPSRMCDRHLRGEYVECLMIAGLFRKKRRIDGFLAHNCIEPSSVVARFAALKREMRARGYNAKKTLRSVQAGHLPPKQRGWKINRAENRRLLAKRCVECRKRLAKRSAV